MFLKINTSNKKRFFNVPCFIVDDYIKIADASALKLILYLLSSEDDDFDPNAASKAIGCSLDSIDDALLFWKQQGVITDGSDKERSTAAVTKAVCEAPATSQTIGNDIKITHSGYSAKEIASMIEQNDEMKELFCEAEKTLGRILKHSDHETLISLSDYYGFSIHSIILILEYCRDLEKTSVRYIEAVAKDFFEKGITDFLEIDTEIKTRKEKRSFESSVHKAFGLSAKLTTKQSEYINSWRDMGFDIEMMSAAMERCVDATNKISFPYINKILESWHEKKIFCTSDIDAEKTPTKKSSNESSFDLEEFDNYTLGITDKP